MCNDIPVRAVRARSGKQRQSACRASWIVDASCHPSSAENGRFDWQGDKSGKAPARRFSLPLDEAERGSTVTPWYPRIFRHDNANAHPRAPGTLFLLIARAAHVRSGRGACPPFDHQAILYERPRCPGGGDRDRCHYRIKGLDVSLGLSLLLTRGSCHSPELCVCPSYMLTIKHQG